MGLSKFILKRMGWRFEINVDLADKCVICVAPHTSNWDFIIGELCARAVKLKAGFLMKKTWFFFPLGLLLKSLGGIPVDRGKHSRMTESIVSEYDKRKVLRIAVTPEGTRSPNGNWHKGFLHITREAGVQLLLAYFDYKNKVLCIEQEYKPCGDVDRDLEEVKNFYKTHGNARYPAKFTT